MPNDAKVVTNLTEQTILDAVRSFIMFCCPTVEKRHIIFGDTNNITLPKCNDDIFIVTPISQTRRGTDITEYPEGEDCVYIKEYVNCQVEIDAYSRSQFDAQDRIQTIETVYRSQFGVEFFKNHSIDCQHCEASRNVTSTLDSNQYVSRWLLDLELGFWKIVSIPQEFFDSVSLDGIVNVDVRFPPND